MIHSTYPYLIDEIGSVNELSPNGIKKSVTLNRENEHKHLYRDFNTLEILEGEQYSLFFWEGGWKFIGNSIANNGNLLFNNVSYGYLIFTFT